MIKNMDVVVRNNPLKQDQARVHPKRSPRPIQQGGRRQPHQHVSGWAPPHTSCGSGPRSCVPSLRELVSERKYCADTWPFVLGIQSIVGTWIPKILTRGILMKPTTPDFFHWQQKKKIVGRMVHLVYELK